MNDLCYEYSQDSVCTVADWDSMGRVITQTRDQAFQTRGRAFSVLFFYLFIYPFFQRWQSKIYNTSIT